MDGGHANGIDITAAAITSDDGMAAQQQNKLAMATTVRVYGVGMAVIR